MSNAWQAPSYPGFTGIPFDELNRWYLDARRAYQRLQTGELVVEVLVDGYMTKFNRVNADALLSYIYRLEAEIKGRDCPSGVSITF